MSTNPSTQQKMSQQEAIDLAVFAMSMWKHPIGDCTTQDLDALDNGAEEAIDRLRELKEELRSHQCAVCGGAIRTVPQCVMTIDPATKKFAMVEDLAACISCYNVLRPEIIAQARTKGWTRAKNMQNI